MTVVIQSFVADSSLLDCCDLVFFCLFVFGVCFFLHLMLAGRQPFGVLRWFQLFCFIHLVWAVCLTFREGIFHLPPAFVVCSFFLCHRHLWFVLSFFATGICVRSLSFVAFSAVGIRVRLFVFALLVLVSVYLSVFGTMRCACSSASSLEIRTGFFCKSVTLWTALQILLWSKPHLVFRHKVYKIALSEVLATQMGMTEVQHKSQLIWVVQIWPIFTSQRVDSAVTHAWLCFGLLVNCYSLLQHSRPAW